mmetsp:Transcript_51950/g.123675  ORF Transcript_51950/g.123675 Transcript_51950/m.123675 type:complete len:200 (+) Transcript_51950:648-1247(+)
MVTAVWLSEYVEKIWVFLQGIVLFRSISFVMTPPAVSNPKDKGVTSTKTISLRGESGDLSPPITAACTAAPYATASSGLIDLQGSLPKYSSIIFCTFGIRVEPPMRTTSSTLALDTLASASTLSTDSMDRLKRSELSSSNLARVTLHEKSAPSRRLSTSIIACVAEDKVLLAESHSAWSRFSALLLDRMLMPLFFRSKS